MPRNVCCVPGCPVVAQNGVPLHYFPCPEKDAERFRNWVNIIGGDIASLDSTTIHKTQRICRRHFQKEFLYPKNRLCKLAVPSLLLPTADVSAPSQMVPDCQTSTSQEAILLNLDVVQDSTGMVEYRSCSSAPSMSPLISDCEPSTYQEAILHCDVIRPMTTGTVEHFKPSSSEPVLKHKQEENKVKKLEQTLRRVLKAKQIYRKKYLLAKKIRKKTAFEIVTKNMSSAAKSLLYMQVKGSDKKARGRRFTVQEKILALSLYKPSPEAYSLLSQHFVLPSRRTLQNILEKVDSKAGINQK